MTIDSGWVGVFKEEVPEAFRSAYPFQGPPNVAYIDGMPLLMISEKNVQTWDDLLRNNYARHIIRYFRLGCKAVVLAFDDYDRVPASKAITQANRCKKKAPYEFGEGSQLPPTMPSDFNEKLSNRTFKRRVIDMICNRVAEHVRVGTAVGDAYTRSLVIDYTGCPIVFKAEANASQFDGLKPEFLADVPPMGEADVKFLRWAEHFGGNMISCSVDGDFIPIALMRYEEQMLQLKLHQQRERSRKEGVPHTPQPAVHNIALYRIKYKQKLSPPSAAASNAALLKRASSGCAAPASSKKQRTITVGKRGMLTCSSAAEQESGNNVSAAFTKTEQTASATTGGERVGREFEYVDIPKLYKGLRDALTRMCSTVPHASSNPLYRYHFMRMLAVLIGLGGTDFSRGLSYVGPATLWKMLVEPSVMESLLKCYDLKSRVVCPDLATHSLVCQIYMQKFATHFRKAKFSLEDCNLKTKSACDSDSEDEMMGMHAVLDVLRDSGLSDKTRENLPSVLKVHVTFRNINWLLHYWTCVPPVRSSTAAAAAVHQGQAAAVVGEWDYSGCYPNPISKEFGFKHRTAAAASKGKGKQKTGGAGKSTAGKTAPMCSVMWYDEGALEEQREGGEDREDDGEGDNV